MALIMTLIFGGETMLTFLHPSSPPPPWLTSAFPLALFSTVHFTFSRSPVSRLVPLRAPFLWELAAAPVDGLVCPAPPSRSLASVEG